MRFGKSADEAKEEPGRGGGGEFIRYLKDGDNVMRILQDPPEWTYFWEHFSPAGFSFPCPRSLEDPLDMCPGCSSDNEKMKKAQRRIAFNVLVSFNGQEYVNAFKVGTTVADKLENRYKRFGTVTDRDYTITRYKSSGDRYDFDVEGSTPTPVDLHKEEWKDIEALLQQAWDDAWGNPATAEANQRAVAAATAAPTTKVARPTIAATPKVQPEEPPFEEERTYQEGDLRSMAFDTLVQLIKDDMHLGVPTTLTTSDAVVDWLMSIQS